MVALACLLALSAAWMVRTRRFGTGSLAFVLVGLTGLVVARFEPPLLASQTARSPGGMAPAIAAEAARLGPGTAALLARVSIASPTRRPWACFAARRGRWPMVPATIRTRRSYFGI